MDTNDDPKEQIGSRYYDHKCPSPGVRTLSPGIELMMLLLVDPESGSEETEFRRSRLKVEWVKREAGPLKNGKINIPPKTARYLKVEVNSP